MYVCVGDVAPYRAWIMSAKRGTKADIWLNSKITEPDWNHFCRPFCVVKGGCRWLPLSACRNVVMQYAAYAFV